MSKASHTKKTTAGNLRLVPGLGLVDLGRSGLSETLAGKVEVELGKFAERMHQGLLSASIGIGMEVLGEILEADVTRVAGPKGKHDPNRTARRHGTEPSKLPLGGRIITVDKPRVRSADNAKEITLGSWEALSSTELLNRHALVSMLTGVSTRTYMDVLEPVGADTERAASSISRSAVSRRFIAGTKERLEHFRSRPLGDRHWLVVYIDGFGFGEETLVGALGIDDEGSKMPLSVIHGTTENKAVCKKLLDDLEDRGLDPSSGILFVVDGGKAIFHAVTDKWGDVALVQRCREHKRRNVIDLMPKSDHAWVNRELNRAWGTQDADEAERALRTLASKIERTHPDAASSLREGLTHTVTINRLGITGALARTLATTNPMESTVDIVKVHARNVKRWRKGDMRLRWAAAGMLAAEAQYRRVKGFGQLPKLKTSLAAAIIRNDELAKAS